MTNDQVTKSDGHQVPTTAEQVALAKIERQTQALDGFDYDDEYENQEEAAGGVIVGSLLKFSNDATWIVNGEEVPADLELTAIDRVRVVVYWGPDKRPVKEKTRVLAPHERIPDIDALNEAVPKSEWRMSPNGTLQGPYQLQRVLYLVDTRDMSRYTFPTSTLGGERAIRELYDRIQLMRRFRGAHVCPVVTLSDTFFPTRFGGRQRPHFIIKRWVVMGGGQTLPEPEHPLAQLESKVAPTTAPEQPREYVIEGVVEPPTTKEEFDDEIPF